MVKYQKKRRVHKGRSREATSEAGEEMVADVSRGVGATVAIVDADKGAEGAGLDLTLVLENLVGLDHGHGKLTTRAAAEVPVPEEPIPPLPSHGPLTTTAPACGVSSSAAKRPPQRRQQPHQLSQHPTSLAKTLALRHPPAATTPETAGGGGDRAAFGRGIWSAVMTFGRLFPTSQNVTLRDTHHFLDATFAFSVVPTSYSWFVVWSASKSGLSRVQGQDATSIPVGLIMDRGPWFQGRPSDTAVSNPRQHPITRT
ncbi:hypothetical protein BHM03_00006117 [Ensete ventricosum]|nr:hypothetical protein BHM03_00006117 [Ensete ventricosum]